MIRWWRTGWAPIQQALDEQRIRDLSHLRDNEGDRDWISALRSNGVSPRVVQAAEEVAVRNLGGITVGEASEGFRRFGEFLHRHPELIEDT